MSVEARAVERERSLDVRTGCRKSSARVELLATCEVECSEHASSERPHGLTEPIPAHVPQCNTRPRVVGSAARNTMPRQKIATLRGSFTTPWKGNQGPHGCEP